MNMYLLLLECFYDGMTIDQAKSFIARCYGETPTEKDVSKAKKAISNCTCKEWK